jgi:hypothetical protein
MTGVRFADVSVVFIFVHAWFALGANGDGE